MHCDIVESYHDYEPPFPIVPIIRDLMKCVPKKHWNGLNCIVLTDSAGQSRDERRAQTLSRGRKVSLNEALGFCSYGTNAEKPYIQLHIDQILMKQTTREATERLLAARSWWAASAHVLRGMLRRFARPYSRRVVLARVLYHELGHHIHHTQHPEHREPENVADDYMFEFLLRMTVRRWYFVLVAYAALAVSPSFWRFYSQARTDANKYEERKREAAARRKARRHEKDKFGHRRHSKKNKKHH